MQRSKGDQIGFQTSAFTTHLESAPIGIGIADNGTIKFSNRKLCSMLGYTAKELVGKNLKVLYPDKKGSPRDHNITLSDFDKDRNRSLETKFSHKNGSLIDILMTVSPLELSNTLFTAIDITKYKKMEAAAQESEEHIQSLMKSATNFAVYRLAPDDTAPLKVRVVFVSSSITDLLGLSEPMKFEKWFETIHPEDLGRTLDALKMAWERHYFNETYRICHAVKGEVRWIHAVTHDIVDESGNTKFMNGIFIDITEQKRAESALRRSEQALLDKTENLRRANTELNALLKQRDEDKLELEANVMSNVREFIVPYLELLKGTGLAEMQETLLRIIDTNLNDMTGPLSRGAIAQNLTPAEYQIANFVKLGKTSKEIADTLNLSVNTVDTHRRNIRKKIGIKGEKGNLRTHLQSLS